MYCIPPPPPTPNIDSLVVEHNDPWNLSGFLKDINKRGVFLRVL